MSTTRERVLATIGIIWVLAMVGIIYQTISTAKRHDVWSDYSCRPDEGYFACNMRQRIIGHVTEYAMTRAYAWAGVLAALVIAAGVVAIAWTRDEAHS